MKEFTSDIKNSFDKLKKISEEFDSLDKFEGMVFIRDLKSEREVLNKSFFEYIINGEFWNDQFFEKFSKLIKDVQYIVNNIKEKEILSIIESIVKDFIDSKGTDDKYTEEGFVEERLYDYLKNALIEDVKKLKEYFNFLNDILFSLKKIKQLPEDGYNNFDFEEKEYLKKELTDNKPDIKTIISFLIKIWSIEINTIVDTREHVGLGENLSKLLEVEEYLSKKNFELEEDKNKKNILCNFLNFLIWKHRIDLKKFQEKEYSPPDNYKILYHITRFHKLADKLEDEIYYKRINKKEARKKIERNFKDTDLGMIIQSQKIKNISDIGWENAICLARYIKDFVGYSEQGDITIKKIIEYIKNINGNDYDKIFLKRNLLYIENFHLSFLIDAYKKGEGCVDKITQKIEEYDNSEDDDSSYFREYKLGFYFYIKAKKTLKA